MITGRGLFGWIEEVGKFEIFIFFSLGGGAEHQPELPLSAAQCSLGHQITLKTH